jgi:hypothetical protein
VRFAPEWAAFFRPAFVIGGRAIAAADVSGVRGNNPGSDASAADRASSQAELPDPVYATSEGFSAALIRRSSAFAYGSAPARVSFFAVPTRTMEPRIRSRRS